MGAYRYKLSTKTVTAASADGPVTIGLIRFAYKPCWDEPRNRKMDFQSGCPKARAYWRERQRPALCAYENYRGSDTRDYDGSPMIESRGFAPVYVCKGATMIDEIMVFAGYLIPKPDGSLVFERATPKQEI